MMKRLFILLVLLSSLTAFSDEFKVASFMGASLGDSTGDFIEQEIKLRFDDEKDELLFIFDKADGKTLFTFDKAAREQVISILKLYAIWEKAALEKELTLISEINSVDAYIYWEYKGEWHSTNLPVKVKFFLYSHSAEEQRLMIGFEKGYSYRDESIKRGVNPLFLTTNETEQLTKYFDDSYIKAAGEKSEERRFILIAALIFVIGLTLPIFLFLLVKSLKSKKKLNS